MAGSGGKGLIGAPERAVPMPTAEAIAAEDTEE